MERTFNAGQRFEIRRCLGSGGMGVVYEAFDRERQELVALKTLRRLDGRMLTRFKHEFRALHDLAHRNLAGLGELFDGETEPFFTMELVRGVSFLDYVRGRDLGADAGRGTRPTGPTALAGPGAESRASTADLSITSGDSVRAERFPEPRVVEPIAYDEARLRAALKQLAVGVAALHEAGMVHRDIKPSNILVTPEGRVVLLDFGLVAEAAEGQPSSEDGGAGTVEYMAPEQALSGQVTPAADWYSLGVLLFEALTGALPHTGRTPYELILKKQQYLAAPPRQFVETVPPDLDALCSGLLALEPTERPGARDIFDRLGIDEQHGLVLDPDSAMVSLSLRTPFVGRGAELARLRAAYHRVGDGPLLFMVQGVSGVGKSQLVEEFLAQLAAEEPEALVLSGRCYEREVVSFKAFDGIAEALARHLAHLPAAQVAELMPPRAALLARLFPVLKRVEIIAGARLVPDAAEPLDQRRRMFTALREVFLRLAERHRLVWYIDDLQWTDADSLFLLQDLIAHEDRLPVLLVATARPVDDAPRRALLAQIEELAPTERLALEDLPPDEARTLAGLLLPGQDASDLDALAADAGGHPLFLHELARHLGASRSVPATGATLDEMLTARIDRLSAEVRAVLQVVSVFGGPLTQEVAALAAERSDADLVKAARVLRAAHLVRTDGVSRRDRIVAYHDRVREHVTARLDATRKRHLHERLALALEQTGAAEHDPRALVRHARAAGRRNLAARHALLAAHHAAAALAFNQAAEFFALALELGTHDEATRRAVRIDLATALVNAGRGPEAAETFMAAAEGAEPAVRLDCQRRAADQWLVTGHLERGLDTLRASLTDIGEPLAPTPQRALARLLWNRMRLRLRGLGARLRVESQVPVEVLRRLDVLRATAHGLAMVDNIRGADFNGRFLRLALRTGEPLRLVQALATEVVFLASQGGRAGQRARRVYGRLSEIAGERPDDAYFRTWLLLADGAASFFEGRFPAARAALEQAESVVADTAGTTYERNNVRVFRVHSLRQLGALRENGLLIAESVRSGRQRGDRYLEATLRLLQVQAKLAQDDPAEATRILADVPWSPLEGGFHTQHWHELEARAELALYQGRAREARQELAPAFAELQRSMLLRVNTIRAVALDLRGRLLLAAAREGSPAPEGGPAPETSRTRETCAEVARLVKRLAQERTGFATVFEWLLRAGLAALDPKQTEEDAVACLRRAVTHADDQAMALHRAVAQYRLGHYLGGDEGHALRTQALTWAATEGILRPQRLFAIVSEGGDVL